MILSNSQHSGDTATEERNATMAKNENSRKGAQVSCTIPQTTYDALEDHRWTVRKTMTELMREAVDEYVEKHGIKVESGDEAVPATEDAKAKAPTKA